MTVEFLNLGKQQLNWIDQLLKQYIPHSNASFSNHLYRTGALLQKWGADPDTVIAGKYHAIYSTSSFEFSLVPITNRIEVASLLGNRAEFLIWCYCFLNYDWFWKYFDEIGCYSDAYAQGSHVGMPRPYRLGALWAGSFQSYSTWRRMMRQPGGESIRVTEAPGSRGST